jgi:uncharacterized 2Fe-2S/4Fe-4S cluster protein (DUF4445 family)
LSPLIHGSRRIDLAVGKTLFDYADDLSVRVPTSCGRTGECHECIVEVRRGADALSGPSEAEGFLRGDYRLACQAEVTDPSADIEFAVLRRQPRILTRGVRREVALDPLTRRDGDGVWYSGTRLEDYRGAIFGIAVDVGTTTVVMNLVNLETGAVAHTASFENPQRFGGSDVMHRISYDSGPYSGELRSVMLSAINFEIGDMVKTVGTHRRRIYEAVFVGNATMRDLLFGLDVQPIGERPYKSTVELAYERGERDTTSITTTAKELGLRIFPDAAVYAGPLIGSHVGSDVAADMLAIGMDEMEDVVMLVDVGTNTEVVVGNRHRLMAASCPAGPAFEGGQVTYAMPGYDGAIEAVRIKDGAIELETIGGGDPEGICGSGLVDLLAELRRTEKMTELGVYPDGSSEFIFAPEQGMTLSRADISNLAQAKSANYCGQAIVLRNYGIGPGDVARLYLAGGFANYINEANAVDIGFIASVPQERIKKVGNASLQGATIMLTSGAKRKEIEALAKRVEHVELETTPDFFDMFVEGCHFRPMSIE